MDDWLHMEMMGVWYTYILLYIMLVCPAILCWHISRIRSRYREILPVALALGTSMIPVGLLIIMLLDEALCKAFEFGLTDVPLSIAAGVVTALPALLLLPPAVVLRGDKPLFGAVCLEQSYILLTLVATLLCGAKSLASRPLEFTMLLTAVGIFTLLATLVGCCMQAKTAEKLQPPPQILRQAGIAYALAALFFAALGAICYPIKRSTWEQHVATWLSQIPEAEECTLIGSDTYRKLSVTELAELKTLLAALHPHEHISPGAIRPLSTDDNIGFKFTLRRGDLSPIIIHLADIRTDAEPAHCTMPPEDYERLLQWLDGKAHNMRAAKPGRNTR